ncbi:MAG: hypothetical protein RIE24_04245 [Silicimonas sp.]|jgi:hypothetical protein|uniref:hypothetical protein n=1 Tax=Roseitalea porphyridii TaxID=1852022 RepID=UPI0032F03E46
MMATGNPYLPAVHRAIPRLLALFNIDPTDTFLGCGDRRFWAWKLIDFPNATYQGAAFGLAHLCHSEMLPDHMDRDRIAARIAEMIDVVPRLADRRGGLAEALPQEGSFCVTGLVLGDCLGALQRLEGVLGEQDRRQLAEGLSPLTEFLLRQDEHHGIISNHLATNALGMVRWAKLSGDERAWRRAGIWIDRIRVHASSEGWMSEYGGADPGYQSWCSSALAQIDNETDRFDLMPLLERSYSFLEAFAFPDGRFANGCGARLTRFLFPGGAEMLADRLPAARRLAVFARRHYDRGSFVTLDAIDEPNLAPFFNDAVLSSVHWSDAGSDASPFLSAPRDFPEAGLFVRPNREGRVVAINVRRGGWTFCSAGPGQAAVLQPEPMARDEFGGLCAAACGRLVAEDGVGMVVEADLIRVARMSASPFKFLVLRMMALTVFRSRVMGNWVKRVLAWLLVTGEGRRIGRVRRRITLETGSVADEVITGTLQISSPQPGYSPMHMASQGYWQTGDDTKA